MDKYTGNQRLSPQFHNRKMSSVLKLSRAERIRRAMNSKYGTTDLMSEPKEVEKSSELHSNSATPLSQTEHSCLMGFLCDRQIPHLKSCLKWSSRNEHDAGNHATSLLERSRLSRGYARIVNAVHNSQVGFGALDTACARTVCGKEWLESYIKLCRSAGLRIEDGPENELFKFGGGERLPSRQYYLLPIMIYGCSGILRVSCVDAPLQLLLGKDFCRQARISLDLENSLGRIKVVHEEEWISLDEERAGHLRLSIKPDSTWQDPRQYERIGRSSLLNEVGSCPCSGNQVLYMHNAYDVSERAVIKLRDFDPLEEQRVDNDEGSSLSDAPPLAPLPFSETLPPAASTSATDNMKALNEQKVQDGFRRPEWREWRSLGKS